MDDLGDKASSRSFAYSQEQAVNIVAMVSNSGGFLKKPDPKTIKRELEQLKKKYIDLDLYAKTLVEYYKEGKIPRQIRAQIAPILFPKNKEYCGRLHLMEYMIILAFIFAIEEINMDSSLLPNITLGYHIYDTCADPKNSVMYALKILSGYQRETPNYSCMKSGEVAGFVGDSGFTTTLALAQLLSLYRYTQIVYQVTDPLLSDREKYPNLYRMVPNDSFRYLAFVKFLEHFGWNWVGIITPKDGGGEMELRELRKLMTSHGICIEFVIKLTESWETNKKMMNKYMQKVNFEDKCGDSISFNEYGELPNVLHIENWIALDLKQDGYFQERIRVGWFEEPLEGGMQFSVRDADITWKNNTRPESRCNKRCLPGHRKASTRGIHSCCYHCVPCAKGEVSNVTVITVIYSVITLAILGVFIHKWDTPIVKANNRTVSFILLTSILLSFLCVFLFLGRPVDITCMLRQKLFAIFFSVALSSVLGKTITVCIVFKATKPGSSWKKWISVNVASYVVWSCFSFQVLSCIIWLSIFPPHKEYDMTSHPGRIIIQCNEGSVIGFYSVLGYMGFLAAVSFLLAFMVRTLPDSFNEAKYITFSMLVFCSVWIAMIPAYLSTRGKYMVAVEVFAILTSSAGILSCIFFPKTYIIVIRPELNCHKLMMRKN
ncbi:vomeronasal type-2 receptor 26-like [Hyperolius riggenbachi]|uniref:vomeronasal type-2 receptor 26-like n=1 Tax=Hyperolius riggenbachi TaxID=752182 RepID=UPI0035A2DEAA